MGVGNRWVSIVCFRRLCRMMSLEYHVQPCGVSHPPPNICRIEADLGRFSEAIYKKIISDAKQQRFQGFRPGTIPPHLEPTYRAYSMDECARETVLEAMQQNNIRPFSTAREEIKIVNVRIPPPVTKNTKKKSSGKKTKGMATGEQEATPADPGPEPIEPQWSSFEDMKGAIDAGWKVSRRRHAWCGHILVDPATNVRHSPDKVSVS
jgi:hypothetical protein